MSSCIAPWEEVSQHWDLGRYANFYTAFSMGFFMIFLNCVTNFPIVGVMMHLIPEAKMQPFTAEDSLTVITIYLVSTGPR